MGEADEKHLTTTLARVQAQLEKQIKDREEEAVRARKREESEAHRISLEVEEQFARDRAENRRRLTWAGSILVALGGAFAWAYSTVEKAQEQAIEEAERKTRVDIELKAATEANEKNADALREHTDDFNDYRGEQTRIRDAEHLEDARRTEMLEKLLKAEGRRVPTRDPEHKEVLKKAGWDEGSL